MGSFKKSQNSTTNTLPTVQYSTLGAVKIDRETVDCLSSVEIQPINAEYFSITLRLNMTKRPQFDVNKLKTINKPVELEYQNTFLPFFPIYSAEYISYGIEDDGNQLILSLGFKAKHKPSAIIQPTINLV